MGDSLIRINFQVDTELGAYSDAIYLTQTQYDALPDLIIVDLIAARVSAWIALVKTKPVQIDDDSTDTQVAEVDASNTQVVIDDSFDPIDLSGSE